MTVTAKSFDIITAYDTEDFEIANWFGKKAGRSESVA